MDRSHRIRPPNLSPVIAIESPLRAHSTIASLCPDNIDDCADTDDDGLSDGTEKNGTGPLTAYGATNPVNADTDGDGIKDGIEVGLTTGIADPDGAGR